MATHVARRLLRTALLKPYWSSSTTCTITTTSRTLSDNVSNEGEGKKTISKVHPAIDPYHGISVESFPEKCNGVLLAPVNESDIEIKPDGLIYLPEIKYRRILNKAFGPGGWALMPRGETMHFQGENDSGQLITREYALYCYGRFTAQAVGEHTFFSKNNLGYGKACESAKSNSLMRCCKDLGVVSELWDPQFVKKWRSTHASEVWCENVRSKEKKRLWKRKDNEETFPYPWKELSQRPN